MVSLSTVSETSLGHIPQTSGAVMLDYCRRQAAEWRRIEVRTLKTAPLMLVFLSCRCIVLQCCSAEIVYLVDDFADRSHKLVLHILEIYLRFQPRFAVRHATYVLLFHLDDGVKHGFHVLIFGLCVERSGYALSPKLRANLVNVPFGCSSVRHSDSLLSVFSVICLVKDTEFI